MSRFHSRIDALDRELAPPPSDPGVVVIRPLLYGREGPPIVRRERLITLNVPGSFNDDLALRGLLPASDLALLRGAPDDPAPLKRRRRS